MIINPPFPTVANLQPREGTRAARIDLAFPEDNGQVFDLSQLQNQGELFQCQTLFVDNSVNDKALVLQSSMMLQKINVPAGSQGYIPILAPNPPRFSITCSSAGSSVAIFALNYSVPAALWGFQSVQSISGDVSVLNFPAVQETAENNLPVFSSTAIAVNASAVVLANTAAYKYLRSVEIFCYNATVAASDTFFIIDGTGNGIYPVSVPPLANFTGTLARLSGLNIPKISDNTFAWGFLAKSLSSGYAMTTCGFGN